MNTKFFSAVFIASFLLCTVSGQYVPKKEDIDRFYKTKTYVVMEKTLCLATTSLSKM
ncbi:MAG: hypothetical protein HC896_08740 [Bacteroidales bacterium]|nr:hypothetical protein [Bacteroidales bacterium]